MIALVSLQQLSSLVQPWASAYADSKALSVIVTSLHLGGMLGGGGLAIATDRAVLRISRTDGRAQERGLEDLGAAHGMIIGALAVIVTSGLLFLAADIKTFLPSPVFWLKLTLVFLLLMNGLRLRNAENACQKMVQRGDGAEPTYPVEMWTKLRSASITSLVLWFGIMLVGTTLTSV